MCCRKLCLKSKNNMNNISFVIPAYNSGKTIGQTIDSIVDGNFSEGDEIIIVNDSSTDDTLDIIKSKSLEKNIDIKVITNEINKGCPASRNIGILQSKNDIIMSFDSDNILPPGTVSKLRESLIKNSLDIASVSQIHFFSTNPKLITHKWIFKKDFFQLKDMFAGNINPAPVGNYMFTKESWKRVGGFEELEKGLHESWIFTLKQLSSGSKFFIVPNTHYLHRYGHESLTIREYKNNVEKNILSYAIDELMPFFNTNKKEELKSHNPEWIHNLNRNKIAINNSFGVNGKLVRTFYGIIMSLVRLWKKRN